MSDYSIARDLLVYREAGYANVEGDKGGMTYAGITYKSFPAWSGWVFIFERLTEGPIPHNTIFPQLNKPVSDFYRFQFWDPMNLGLIDDQSVADQLLAIAVHYSNGPVVAGRRIQKILNTKYNKVLKVDGVLGPKTIDAINSVNGFELNNSLFKATVLAYLDSEQHQFIKGFIRRALDCLVG
jgi:lysozyme family protein